MRKIQSHNLAQLLMQLRFTPEGKRRAQLEAAEKLYARIDKDKQYPYDFVCFHITGFQPKGPFEQEIVSGSDLQADLQIFIAKLSGKLAVSVAQEGERVWTIEELALKFNVSTKTINRWRPRGLLARKFVFDDGTHRLGFLESAVERFARENPELVACAGQFRRLTDVQRQQVIRQARSLAAKTSQSRHQITGRIAEKLGIARETVRTILQQYERKHPEKSVFRRPLGRIRPAEAAELFRLYKQGVGIRQLMERFDRSRATVHRIINQRRAATLLARKIEYVPSDEFLQANAREQILGTPLVLDRPEPQKKIEPFDLVGENGMPSAADRDWEELSGEEGPSWGPEPNLLPEYMQVLKITPVLSRDREIELFRRYNYIKHLVAQERHQLRLSKVSAELLSRLEEYLDEAEEIRTLLVEANLRLVVSIAGKHTSDGPSFLELVSKGNFALIQAVEEFDYTKGFRFSRRASLDIAKEYAKASGRSTELTPRRAASLASIQRDMRDTTADVLAIERTRQDLAEVIRQELDEREQYVILHHFGLIGGPIRKKTKTLRQIGDELELTKERIRQIELSALQKLRQCLSREQFEMLTG
jgi:RNA polymerase primary sigma factor